VELRIGCAPDMPLQRLQAFLGVLHAHRGALTPRVRFAPTALQLQQLRLGRLDLGMVHDPGEVPGARTEPLYRGEPLDVVVSLAHRVAARPAARLADLAGDVLLVPPRRVEPGLHAQVSALAAGDGAAFLEVREPPGPDVRDLLFAVASGHGVGLVPRSTSRAAGELGDAVAARPLDSQAQMPDTLLACPARGAAELDGLYATAREVARELYGSSPP
jgi:hypothetical protein